jgi:hypothetical protein
MTGSGKSCLAAAALGNKQLLIEKFKVSITSHSSYSICVHYFEVAYVVRHLLFTTETHIWSRGSPCQICGGQSSIEDGLLLGYCTM